MVKPIKTDAWSVSLIRAAFALEGKTRRILTLNNPLCYERVQEALCYGTKDKEAYAYILPKMG